MVAVVIALLIGISTVYVTLWAAYAGTRERTATHSRMDRRPYARWTAIIRACLQRLS